MGMGDGGETVYRVDFEEEPEAAGGLENVKRVARGSIHGSVIDSLSLFSKEQLMDLEDNLSN